MNFEFRNYLCLIFNKRKSDKNNKPRKNGEYSMQEQHVELLKGSQNNAVDDRRKEFINYGEEDQMEIQGYVPSKLKNIINWCWIVLTGGLLRLVYHWYPHWHLISTHTRVPLNEADKVLIIEKYQDKYTSYYVKSLKILTPQKVMEMENESKKNKQNNKKNSDNIQDLPCNDITNVPLALSVNFGGGVFKDVEKLMMFTCKKLNYIWDTDKSEFVKLKGLDVDIVSSFYHQTKGLTAHEQFTRRLVYGPNQIIIPERGVLTLLFLEVLNPFYIFQAFSFALWFADNYYAYATAILLMSVFGITMSIIQTRRNQRNLKSTVHSCDITTVLRPAKNGIDLIPVVVSTEQLVPGDILEIPPHGCIMHCDAILLTGNCILNEAMLTGESVPVTKIPIPNSSNVMYNSKEHIRHTLFCGTQVIQTRYLGDKKARAMVIRTGFSTAKGGLVRSILYPPPVDFRFEADSYRFVILLACIASIGFIYTIVTKTMRGVSVSELIVEALDLITIVVPPALPAAMTVGRMYAQRRLQKKNIFCISPRTINVSGSIDCVCFDKTGTLTEDGLDMLCVVPTFNKYFQIPIKDIANMVYDKFIFGMVTCHSLTVIDGRLSGDPLDLKMFESTKWLLEDPDVSDHTKFDIIFPIIVKPPKNRRNEFDRANNKNILMANGITGKPIQMTEKAESCMSEIGNENLGLEIGILREFPFSSSLQRMSVIVRRLGAPNFEYYCKGSPEIILTFVNPETVPENFHSVLQTYTQQGYRVIALAYRELFKMTYAKVQRISREKLDVNLELLGLIVLENRLKIETSPIVDKLSDAKIRTIMVTGDNILTALSVARECGIIPNQKSVITINAVTDQYNKNPMIYYTLTNNINVSGSKKTGVLTPNGCGGDYSILSNEMDSSSVVSLATIESCTVNTETDSVHIDMQSNLSKVTNSETSSYCFALDGKCWAAVKQFYPELIPRVITRGAVFARMSPDQKQCLIQELQALGYYVAMVGDGANDVGALRASHCGISLSDTESSVASPFTSKNPNITAIYDVICQGRAALVTSFSIFKYMAAYSLTQFVSVMLLYTIESNLTDIEFLYIDLFIITIFAYFFGKTKAYDKKLVAERPMNSLVGLTPVLSLMTQMVLVIFFQVLAFQHLKVQNWYVQFDSSQKDHKDSVGCVENYTIFTVSSFQYIILALVFSKGKPYRKAMWTNLGLILSAVGLVIFLIYLSISPAEFLAKFFELVLPSWNATHNNTLLINESLNTVYDLVPNNTDFVNLTNPFLISDFDTDLIHLSPTDFKYVLLSYALVNFILSFIVEYLFVDYLVFKKLRFKFHNVSKSKKKFLQIEKELCLDSKWPPLSDNFMFSLTHRQPSCDGINEAQYITIEKTDAFKDENKVLECFFDEQTSPESVQKKSDGETAAILDKNKRFLSQNGGLNIRNDLEIRNCNSDERLVLKVSLPDTLNGSSGNMKSKPINKNLVKSMLEMNTFGS